MKPENYNAKIIDEPTYFNHLLLESEGIRDVVKAKDFDPDHMEVVLTINGVQVSVQNFNNLMSAWGSRVEAQIKREADYFDKEEAVKEKALSMLKDKIGNAYEVLNIIENSTYLLEED